MCVTVPMYVVRSISFRLQFVKIKCFFGTQWAWDRRHQIENAMLTSSVWHLGVARIVWTHSSRLGFPFAWEFRLTPSISVFIDTLKVKRPEAHSSECECRPLIYWSNSNSFSCLHVTLDDAAVWNSNDRPNVNSTTSLSNIKLLSTAADGNSNRN